MPFILTAPVLYFVLRHFFSLEVSLGVTSFVMFLLLDRVMARHERRLYKNIEGLNVDVRCKQLQNQIDRLGLRIDNLWHQHLELQNEVAPLQKKVASLEHLIGLMEKVALPDNSSNDVK